MRRLATIWAGPILVTITLAVVMTEGHAAAEDRRVVAVGSTREQVGPFLGKTVLSTTVRTRLHTDLLISATSECAIAFLDPDLVLPGGIDVDAFLVSLKFWVEVDGVPVPVARADNGRVTFCRLERLNLLSNPLTDREIAVIEADTNTTANGFNWVKRNVGPGRHRVDLKVSVIQITDNVGELPPFAEGRVGKRTLIVEPFTPDN
jgi:hypothetical protein